MATSDCFGVGSSWRIQCCMKSIHIPFTNKLKMAFIPSNDDKSLLHNIIGASIICTTFDYLSLLLLNLPRIMVAIHYYGRLAAKQGWRFDSTFEHKDETGNSIPFVFTVGSGKVISGIETAVKTMKLGGVRRVIIPPSQGYQNTLQEPIPPNFFDRQRLFTTIFNPTRFANGEGSTLATLVFDIELVSLRHR